MGSVLSLPACVFGKINRALAVAMVRLRARADQGHPRGNKAHRSKGKCRV